jgi:hypothetical protein
MVLPARAWVSLLLALIPTRSSVALASNHYSSNGILGRIHHAGAQAMKVDPSTGSVEDGTVTSTKLYSTSQIGQANSAVLEGDIDVSYDFCNSVHCKKSSSFICRIESSIHILYLFGIQSKRPLRVLFLSADTGGGHRASAEALAKQVRNLIALFKLCECFREFPNQNPSFCKPTSFLFSFREASMS